MNEAYIVKGYRTAVGKAPRGLFRFKRPDELAAQTINYMINDIPNLDKRIDDVIVGNAMPEAEQGLNIGRLISLMGLGIDDVPGVTINRYCASGLETIALANSKIKSGMAHCVIAGGVESMSLFQWEVIDQFQDTKTQSKEMRIIIGNGIDSSKLLMISLFQEKIKINLHMNLTKKQLKLFLKINLNLQSFQ